MSVGIELIGNSGCVDKGNTTVAVIAEVVDISQSNAVDSEFQINSRDQHKISIQ